MNDLKLKLVDWTKQFEFKKRKAVASKVIEKYMGDTNYILIDLKDLYAITNGLTYEWFDLLPIENLKDIKNTWNSLQRANNITKTNFFERDEGLLNQFYIIASIGGGNCACINKNDSTIWFEDDEGIHQTDMSLIEFIETCLKGVKNL